MNSSLSISIGQYSHKGNKLCNQDAFGAMLPVEPQLTTKGVAVAIADGISSSDVSQVASQTSVRMFLEDYYCTSETWTVKTAAQKVLQASNSWLFAQNQREHEFRVNKDKGYVCTFSALILKSTTAYLFHLGDAQVTRISTGDGSINESRSDLEAKNSKLEVLTRQHRRVTHDNKSYLSRAMGISTKPEFDYAKLPLSVGDVFFMSTDGVHEYVSDDLVCEIIESNQDSLDTAAQLIVNAAFDRGSEDNLTAQLVRVDSLPTGQANEFLQRLNNLPFPPSLSARMEFDGYLIIRDLNKSSRSHVVLALDKQTQQKVVLKLPSTEGRLSSEYVERFLMEEWIANRLNNAHIVKPYQTQRPRNFCYVVMEYVEGQTLAQWMTDNTKPSLDAVRSIVEQLAKGLQAFHRQEMLHQDLRPHNVMIDRDGTVKIIDFGSTFVSGIEETRTSVIPEAMPGTAQFLAPEYFLGEFGTKRSDVYSLACIAYHMLSGRSPYGTQVAKASTRTAQQRLVYQTVLDPKQPLPAWVDLSLKKALQADPQKRYQELSEFIQDLRKPNPKFTAQTQPPLIERNPVRFWQGVSAVLMSLLAYTLLR